MPYARLIKRVFNPFLNIYQLSLLLMSRQPLSPLKRLLTIVDTVLLS